MIGVTILSGCGQYLAEALRPLLLDPQCQGIGQIGLEQCRCLVRRMFEIQFVLFGNAKILLEPSTFCSSCWPARVGALSHS